MQPAPTTKHLAILEFMGQTVRERGTPPTFAELRVKFGPKTRWAAGLRTKLESLVRRGFIAPAGRGYFYILDRGWEALGVTAGNCPHCGGPKQQTVEGAA